MSESPQSNSSSSSSISWESVSISPLEALAQQYEQEIQQLADSHVAVKQNKLGVDVHSKTGKAAGRLTVKVLAVRGLEDAIVAHPMLANASDEGQSVYVSGAIGPSPAVEKSMKKNARTRSAASKNGCAKWTDSLVFEGIKTTAFSVKMTVNINAGVIADIAIGEVELQSSQFVDQQSHTDWFDLRPPASSTASGRRGKVHLSVTFHYNSQLRLEHELEQLKSHKNELDELAVSYRQNAPLVNATAAHPAAFGAATAHAELYLPGNRFRQDYHHPAAVTRAPLPDKSRVVTPFGRGVVVAFRAQSKMYNVQLDKDPSSKRATVAYLRQADVNEEPTEAQLKMYTKVSTPYGAGEIVEIRPWDDVIVVQTSFGNMYMQRKDVKLPEKSIEDMKNKDLIEEAVKLTETGNAYFRDDKYDDAVFSYLRALGFLQRVDQDIATHKEKAEILQTMIRCHLNIGTCKLKSDAYVDCEIACSNALNILSVLAENKKGNVVMWMGRLGLSEQLMFEDWPSKARFRRAKACIKLEKYAEARADLMIAVRLNPKDKACRLLLDQVTKLINKQKSEEKKAWGGIFENTVLEEVDSDEPVAEAVLQRVAAADPQSTASVDEDSSIFTRKSKSQRERKGRQRAANEPAASGEDDSWFLSTKALAAASIVTAGVAAFAVLAMKQQK